jgi:uncharacterized protein (TIRG00374 family)
MKKYLPWLLRLLGPALLLYFLVFQVDLRTLLAIMREADPWPVILSLLLMPPFIWIKAWRWQRLMRELELDLPLSTAVGLYTVGLFLGATTPGQAGDLIKAWYLRDRGQPLAPAMLSVVLDRLCDLLVMAVVATLGIFAFSSLLPNQALQTALVLLTGGGLLLVTGLLLARGPREWLLTRVLPPLLPQRIGAALERWRTQFSTLTLRPSLVAAISAASLLSASFTFYRLWLLFLALGLDRVPLLVVVSSSALIAILQVLPISIGGVGVRDAVLVPILAVYGYSPEQAITLSVLFLLLNIEHILAGFVVSFWFPLGKLQAQARAVEEQMPSAEC